MPLSFWLTVAAVVLFLLSGSLFSRAAKYKAIGKRAYANGREADADRFELKADSRENLGTVTGILSIASAISAAVVIVYNLVV